MRRYATPSGGIPLFIAQACFPKWNEVGGDDSAIVPYQRGETSGSQSLFMKLLMKDETPMAGISPAQEYILLSP